MIPKVIHFCWLSNEPYPELITRCLASWKKHMPDYKIKKWEMSNFDINSVPFVKEACEKRKWAFAADYIRLYALYTEGGIYLDSDVFVRKSFDNFLNNSSFSSIEYNPFVHKEALKNMKVDENGMLLSEDIKVGVQIQAAVIGAEKGNPFIKECLDWYVDKHFIQSDGTLYTSLILPDILALCAKNRGFVYANKLQEFPDLVLYKSEIFAPHPKLITKQSYAVHCCAGSWRDENIFQRFMRALRAKIYLR